MLKKGEIRMIHKWLREGMSKSSIARRLGISRETVRKYALKPEGYVPVISRKPNENLVDEIYLILQQCWRQQKQIKLKFLQR